MDLKRILVAVDSPNGRDAAFERALSLASATGAELYLLHAVPANQPFSFKASERRQRTSQMRARAEDAGVRIRTVEQHGEPAEIIELHANTRAVDLIILGREVRHRWNPYRSSVAEKVIRRTRVPALVVPSRGTDTASAFRKVLVSVDLSAASKDVMRAAIGVTANEAAQLTVMHTVDALAGAAAVQSPGWWLAPGYGGDALNDAQRSLERIVPPVPAGLEVRLHVGTGPPARTILDQAVSLDADLVVVGRSRGFKMLGSTALRVLRRNERALLVVPSAAPRRTERARAA
jgi:nucleotide-binding universal stress UspA family protein